MFYEDFIMRMIRQATTVIARVLRLKSAGQYLEALESINQLLEDVVGLKATLIDQLDDQSLLSALKRQGELDLDRLVIVAELYRVEGEILAEQGLSMESQVSFSRALHFYLEAMLQTSDDQLAGPSQPIEELLAKLNPDNLQPERRFALYQYFEMASSFKRAELVLRSLLDEPGLQQTIEEELAGFYQRLLEKSDHVLLQGGLSRAEIEANIGRLSSH